MLAMQNIKETIIALKGDLVMHIAAADGVTVSEKIRRVPTAGSETVITPESITMKIIPIKFTGTPFDRAICSSRELKRSGL